MEDWGRYIEAVADALLGKPTSRSRKELRYGSNGSFKVNLETGWWDDWEGGEAGKGRGGGVLALIKREKGLEPKDAIEWMRNDLKLDMEDRRPQRDGDAQPPREPAKPKEKSKLIKAYDYKSERGELVFQVCRMEPKTFLQRRKPQPGDDPADVKGGWVWKRDGITQVPYRLAELMEAIADERTIFLIEGEKDVDNLVDRLGVPGTCNAGGAGKWPDELTPYFRGVDVVIVPDNDPQAKKQDGELRWHPDGRPVLPGQDHAKLVASKLDGVANSVRILLLPDLPIKGDITDWIDAGGTSETLYRLVDERAISPRDYQKALDEIWLPKKFVSKFGAVIWGDSRKTRQKYEYLIKGLIPRCETVLIYGPSQSGKSFLTQDFAMAVARGGDYQGRKVRRGIVIYCAPEAGVGFVDRRMPGYAVGKGVSENDWLPFVCLPARLDLFGDDKQVDDLIEEIKYLVAFLKEKFPDLELEAVVIDTFAKSTPGLDEISGKDMSVVMRRLDRIRDTLKTGLWVVHHKNAAGTGPRGHTSMYAGFEVAIEVGRTEEKVQDEKKLRDKRFMLVQKQREGEDSMRSFFFLRGVILGADEDGEPIPSCVVEWLPSDEQAKAEKERLEAIRMTDQNRVVYRALTRAISEFGVATPSSLNLPKSIARVVNVKYWRQTYRDNFALEDDSPEAVKKALQRGNNFMIGKGVIGRSNPWVWVTGMDIRGEPKRPEPVDEKVEVGSEMDATDWSTMGQPVSEAEADDPDLLAAPVAENEFSVVPQPGVPPEMGVPAE